MVAFAEAVAWSPWAVAEEQPHIDTVAWSPWAVAWSPWAVAEKPRQNLNQVSGVTYIYIYICCVM